MTKQKNKKKYLLIGSIVLALALVIALSIGLTSAKYKTANPMKGHVKFTAELAENIEILEHKTTRQDDGSYTLDPSATATAQEYKLMPGVDIPKDPYVVVTGKTSIPGWLFVEIVESEGVPETVKYSVITSDWTPLTKKHSDNQDVPVTGLHGGTVYVYKAQLTGAQNEPTEFPVLTADTKGNTLIVSDQLPRGTAAYLDFYAYICQVVEDDAATDFEILRAADDTGNGSGNGGN